MPESSYYTGKSELLQWVTDILELQLCGLEELSNGAVYCQLFDAYFADTVNMHRVRKGCLDGWVMFMSTGELPSQKRL